MPRGGSDQILRRISSLVKKSPVGETGGYFSWLPKDIVLQILQYLVVDPLSLCNVSATCKYLKDSIDIIVHHQLFLVSDISDPNNLHTKGPTSNKIVIGDLTAEGISDKDYKRKETGNMYKSPNAHHKYLNCRGINSLSQFPSIH